MNSSLRRICSEFRVEYLNPPFITGAEARPKVVTMPSKIAFNRAFTMEVDIPRNIQASTIKGEVFTFFSEESNPDVALYVQWL